MNAFHPKLPQTFPESWGDSFGQDSYGVWHGVYVGDIEIRFRWIPPGQFMLGSPEDEPERDNDEGPQQRITFEEGYWLAEAACTQALWQAVMKENPSRFKAEQKPVENVSWETTKGFIVALNKLGGAFDFRLPSEAEWEYACRAGTITPFWFGEELITDDANYNGNYPYNNGKEGEYREKTIPVKSFRRNPWGLYLMHGNVWEWCKDYWHNSHEGASLNGEAREKGGDADHVCRGGSWVDDGRDLRSAVRNYGHIGGGSDGFRLARGPESSSPAGADAAVMRRSEGRVEQLNRAIGRIRQAFGYYLPDHVIENLARSSQHLKVSSERMFGVCMATDAAQYTQLAESLTPEDLNTCMNDYYERLFKPVRAHGGIISDVVGDAMLAIWSAHQEESCLRRQACEAALAALRIGQESAPDVVLQTRIGLHAGEIMLGNIGALDHYEYRVVGDIVNTASRIEGLNKQLGTALLVSDAVLSGLEGFISRELGAFRMVGKQKAIVIHELLGRQDDCDQQQLHLCEHFAEGLHAYQRHDWQTAIACFEQVFEFSPGDGPSRYYLERCKLHVQKMLPLPQDGVIVMQKK